MNPSAPRHRSRLFSLRLLVGLLIMAWLVMGLPLLRLKEVLLESFLEWPWWVAGLLFTFTGLTAGAMRWHAILRNQGFQPAGSDVFRAYFIGQFFNSFLPGGCGGDLARAYYATALAPSDSVRAACTVVVDRAIGLLVTILTGCLFIAWQLPFFLSRLSLRLSALFMVLSLLGALLLLAVFFRANLFESSPFWRRAAQSRLGRPLRILYDVFYFYRARPRLLLVASLYSAVNLACLTLACYSMARSLHIPLPLADHFTLFPVITVLTAIPLTPGALGVREGLFAHLFNAFGIAAYRAVPLSLLVYADGLFWSLFGGLLFILHSRDERSRLWNAARANPAPAPPDPPAQS